MGKKGNLFATRMNGAEKEEKSRLAPLVLVSIFHTQEARRLGRYSRKS